MALFKPWQCFLSVCVCVKASSFGHSALQTLAPLSSQIPIFVKSTQRCCQPFTIFLLPAPQPGNSPQRVGWDNYRAHLICFPFIMGHCSALPDIQVKWFFICVVSLFQFRALDVGKPSLIPVSSSFYLSDIGKFTYKYPH